MSDEDLLRKFRSDENAHKLLERFHKKSQMEIYGVSRRELSHSDFLRWLLDSNQSHGLGTFPAERLLECIDSVLLASQNEEKEWQVFSELYSHILSGKVKLLNSVASREVKISNGRVDIIVDCSFNCYDPLTIIIENKVGSKEGDEQTQRYYHYFSKNNEGHNCVYLFLTPVEYNSAPKDGHFLHITYQHLMEFVLEPIMRSGFSQKTLDIVDDYILALEKPASDFEKSNKNSIIMATSTEHRTLLREFWENNQELILAAAQELASSQEDSDAQQSASMIVEQINRTKNLYIITAKALGNSVKDIKWTSMGQAAKGIVGRVIEVISPANEKELRNYVGDNSEYPQYGIFYSETDFNTLCDRAPSNKPRYFEVEFKGQSIFVSKMWDGTPGNNFERFINKINEKSDELGYKYSYKLRD